MVRAFLLIVCTALAACSADGRKDLEGPVAELGQFNLGHNIVIAEKAVKGPLSRDASEKELSESLQAAIADRFDRYDGNGLYHFGVSVEGYVLAAPGIPLIYSPKSLMIINVTVWDDAVGKKINEKPEQLTVFESLSEKTVAGSGLTQSKEMQLENLAVNAAKQIELMLVRRHRDKAWFKGNPEAETALDEDTAIDGDATDVVAEPVAAASDAVTEAAEALEPATDDS